MCFCTGLTILTAITISAVATLVLIVAISAAVFMLRKYHKKQRLLQDYYDVPYHYTLPPLPPRTRVHRMDSGIYDNIPNNAVESETAFSTAAVNSIVCNRIFFTHGQSKIENGDVSFTGVVNTTGTEIFQIKNVSESGLMANPPISDGSGMQENKIEENRARAANINFESNRVVNEGISGVAALRLQEEESITCAEVHVQMQGNASYQPNTNFVFAANPAYGTGIAIAPEIPTEENIAYQHTCRSGQPSSDPDDNIFSATQHNDSLVSDED